MLTKQSATDVGQAVVWTYLLSSPKISDGLSYFPLSLPQTVYPSVLQNFQNLFSHNQAVIQRLFEEVEGFGLWFWTEDHLRILVFTLVSRNCFPSFVVFVIITKMIDEFEKIKQQLAVFGNSMILDYSPYPTGVKDHDYKTWNYIRQLHAFFFSRNLVLEWGNNYTELGFTKGKNIWSLASSL
ncbi:uncharacterized protein LOC117632944 isoform X2 [Prunus dulcis]|uniref:uncharacterized protein LOC117612936 isoform X2 n=1 Tax=Prunus dulcis TaxID=3755 RepID=UPI0014820A18|nr:uncharacterized protein LOC117612936 isoform X2 [Prunus dulcis]XP_034206154.1 uncharacterized protein LOC117620141 isoform X2 [Prunus dulcis]XP_034222476.1 uncharacterized protein LOC117632944 isoform X2 [Prunus dulcis]